jgi:hypothetical protein
MTVDQKLRDAADDARARVQQLDVPALAPDRSRRVVVGFVALVVVVGVIVAATLVLRPGTSTPVADDESLVTSVPEPTPLTDDTTAAQPTPEEVEAAIDLAERFMEARDSHDVPEILSFLAARPAEGLVTIEHTVTKGALMGVHSGRTQDRLAVLAPVADPYRQVAYLEPHGSESLDYDELALAFEVERIFDMRFESAECSHIANQPWFEPRFGPGVSSVYIQCDYQAMSRLLLMAGLEESYRSPSAMRVVDGRISSLTMTGLRFVEAPPEFALFIEWLEAEHGAAPNWNEEGCLPCDRETSAPNVWEGERSFPSELHFVLERPVVDHLPVYLDEYERANPYGIRVFDASPS